MKELLLLFKLGLGGPLAGGEQYLSWIHLDDEVGIVLWALDNDQVSGVINATSPNPVTNKEFSKALGGPSAARRSFRRRSWRWSRLAAASWPTWSPPASASCAAPRTSATSSAIPRSTRR